MKKSLLMLSITFALLISLATGAFARIQWKHESKVNAKTVQVVNFTGSMRIVFPDGTKIVVRKGDEVPPIVAGSVIQVISGLLTLQIGNDTLNYRHGETISIAAPTGDTRTASTPAILSPTAVAAESSSGDSGTTAGQETGGDQETPVSDSNVR